MNLQVPTFFIVSDNEVIITVISDFLSVKFGRNFNKFIFKTKELMLSSLDENTNIVILDTALEDKKAQDFQKLIQNENPRVKFIMLSSTEDIGLQIDEFLNQPINSIVSSKKPLKRFPAMVNKAAVFPINLLTRELKVSRFVAVFILTFITVGVIALIGYYFYNRASGI